MKREMTTIDLIRILRHSRKSRSSWLPMWEDLARGHYRDLRRSWINSNCKTLKEWGDLERGVQENIGGKGNNAEDWLKFAYEQVITFQTGLDHAGRT
jgi:hypothetical protein